MGCENKADGARGEIVNIAPYHWANVKSKIGTIEMKSLLFKSVIQRNVKAPGHRNDQLLEFSVGMCSPVRSARNIVSVVHPPNIKRNMPFSLNKCEVPPGIGDLWEIYYFAEVEWRHDRLRKGM